MTTRHPPGEGNIVAYNWLRITNPRRLTGGEGGPFLWSIAHWGGGNDNHDVAAREREASTMMWELWATQYVDFSTLMTVR